MPDRSDHDADRLDSVLNAESDERASDDLTAFADRVMRTGSLPGMPYPEPSRLQRERMRERVFGDVQAHSMEELPMMTPTFSANDTASDTPLPPKQEEVTSASWFSMLTTAALIAIIGVASVGLMRGSFDFMPNVAGPEPTGAPGIAGSPEASSANGSACDVDGQVYVFADTVPDIDTLDTAVRLDGDGTLTLLCDEEETVIATRVRDAATMLWPGVIVMALENDALRLLNLTNDSSLDLQGAHLFNDGRLDLTTAFVRTGAVDPWALAPVNADHTDWRIIDQRTMQSFQLSDELGKAPPQAYEPSFGHLTGTDVAVLTWHSEASFTATTPVAPVPREVSRLDRAALVLPGSIEDRRWIDVQILNMRTPLERISTQAFSVSQDGELLAYKTAVNDTLTIRIEHAVDGTHLVDVSLGEAALQSQFDTRFILAGHGDRLVVADDETVRIYALRAGSANIITEHPETRVIGILPTADPATVLLSHNNSHTSVTPVDVASGEVHERYQYVSPAYMQIFGDDEIPETIVRIVSDAAADIPATIQLMNPSTGEVVLESDPVDVHPIQIVSFNTYLRDRGSVAVVPIGYNRAVVMNADAGEVWEIDAPIDDDRLWRFSITSDGTLITAWPDPALGSTEYVDGYIATLDPAPDWVPIEQGSAEETPLEAGTPVPDGS